MDTLHLFHTIRVIGLGGGGSNAVDRMVQVGVAGVDFIAANTDVQALQRSDSRNLIHLGPRVTRGLGAGANPEVGARAVYESRAAIEDACHNTELLFITAGMGGGTGSGAAPAVARIARNAGTIVVGVVTMPFAFEGPRRRANAEAAIANLRPEVDTLVVVYNDQLLSMLDPKHARMDLAFRIADECLRQAVEGITGIINNPGTINLDFADVKNVLRDGGLGHFSIGYGRGESAAQEAMRRALTSPLLGRESIQGARSVIVNFRGGEEMTLYDVQMAMEPIAQLAATDAPIFFGTCEDPSLEDRVEVTLMAVGLEEVRPTRATRPAPTKQPATLESVFPSAAPRAMASAPAPKREAVFSNNLPRYREPVAREAAPEPIAAEVTAAPEVPPAPIAPQRDAADERIVAGPWAGVPSRYTESSDDPYPMDDLSIPAFLRRRNKRASA
jgi:cell division protein FtsZ